MMPPLGAPCKPFLRRVARLAPFATETAGGETCRPQARCDQRGPRTRLDGGSPKAPGDCGSGRDFHWRLPLGCHQSGFCPDDPGSGAPGIRWRWKLRNCGQPGVACKALLAAVRSSGQSASAA